MKIYLGEHLRPNLDNAEPVAAESGGVDRLFTKVATALGAEIPETEGVSFGPSFVKYAETHDASVAREFVGAMGKVAELLRAKKITAIDRNLRALFTSSGTDEDLKSEADIRGELERITGQPEV